ncbi:MAG: hypothetical protein GAK28_03238 [Luteibacter sp.]|nr:MAG: hypothetical protein GAK28_03238 [Luteibacter sp.]
MKRVRPSLYAARADAGGRDASHATRRALSQRGYCRKHYRSYPLNVMYQGMLRPFACVECHPAMRVYEPKPSAGWVSR